LHIEFARINGLQSRKRLWAAVIRNAPKQKHSGKAQELLLNAMSDNLRVPYAQVRSLIGVLSEQHGHFNYRDRDVLLGQIRSGIEHVGQLWNNFLEIYDLEVRGVVL